LDSSKFEKKLFEQEQNKMKDQLEAATETIKHLGKIKIILYFSQHVLISS
jgi:hypothetical protein